MAASARFFAVLALALVASASAFKHPKPTYHSVAEAVAQNGQLSTLLSLVVKADLAAALGPGFKGTVFAPTNKAFAALPKDIVEAVTADKVLLTNVLTYHVSPKRVNTLSFLFKKTIPTLFAGQYLHLGKGLFKRTVKGAGNVHPAIVTKKIKVGKATIYIIDTVLLPK